jgi:hypothetical protein
MARVRYAQIRDGEWTDWDWHGNKEMCCDCHLVHVVNYRLRASWRWPFIFIQQQNYRDDKTTNRSRRYYKAKGRLRHKVQARYRTKSQFKPGHTPAIKGSYKLDDLKLRDKFITAILEKKGINGFLIQAPFLRGFSLCCKMIRHETKGGCQRCVSFALACVALRSKLRQT